LEGEDEVAKGKVMVFVYLQRYATGLSRDHRSSECRDLSQVETGALARSKIQVVSTRQHSSQGFIALIHVGEPLALILHQMPSVQPGSQFPSVALLPSTKQHLELKY